MVSPSTTCFTVAEFGEVDAELLLQLDSINA